MEILINHANTQVPRELSRDTLLKSGRENERRGSVGEPKLPALP